MNKQTRSLETTHKNLKTNDFEDLLTKTCTYSDLLAVRDQSEDGGSGGPGTKQGSVKAQQVTKILWPRAAAPTIWKAGERSDLQNPRPPVRSQTNNSDAAPGPKKEPCDQITYFWCAFQDNERMARNKIRTVVLEPPSQAQFYKPMTNSEHIKLIDRESNNIHYQANQTTQLKKTHRLGAVIQIEPEEDGLVRIPARRMVLVILLEEQ